MHPRYNEINSIMSTEHYETKNNIRRATDEARKDIPRYTQAANEYQEQTIQTAREIADNFLESQKEIINSLQSTWVSQWKMPMVFLGIIGCLPEG